MKRAILTWTFLLVAFVALPAVAGERHPVEVSQRDRCPVCGMFVAKYPDFIAQVIHPDGSYAVFDGVKDMMKYILNLEKYAADKKPSDIEAVFVKDYYKLEYIDGFKAHYVLGSNVFGPMGKELIPFETEAAADEFMVDHAGKQRLTFGEITLDTLKHLDGSP